MNPLRTLARSLVVGAAGLAALGVFNPSDAMANPAEDALKEAKGEVKPMDSVQNRFFEKSKRFEIAPVLGVVPNNPMVKRRLGGVLLAYHFSETFAVGGQIFYAPDLGSNDLKGLTNTLVTIAHNGDANVDFQQPIDKMVLGATFSANWIPVYGKINLVGEAVLNFDLYGSAGTGLVAMAPYYAVYDEEKARSGSGEPPVSLEPRSPDYFVPINLGIGADFFLTQTIALKLDARSYLYVGPEQQYDPDNPTSDKRLYNMFIATAGLALYFPKMPARISDF